MYMYLLVCNIEFGVVNNTHYGGEKYVMKLQL